MTQQIPGVPEGWELVRVGVPDSDDWLVGHEGNPVAHAMLKRPLKLRQYAIIRKIEKPAAYRPFANAEEFKPHRDRWICRLYNGRPDAKGCYKVSAYDDRGTFANDGKTSYQDMFEEGRVFDDGTPFGVRIDE
jgi:hypothetical protein